MKEQHPGKAHQYYGETNPKPTNPFGEEEKDNLEMPDEFSDPFREKKPDPTGAIQEEEQLTSEKGDAKKKGEANDATTTGPTVSTQKSQEQSEQNAKPEAEATKIANANKARE